MDRSDPAFKGQAGYNRFMLAIYDPFVLGFHNPSGVEEPDVWCRRALPHAYGSTTPRRRPRHGLLLRESCAAFRNSDHLGRHRSEGARA